MKTVLIIDDDTRIASALSLRFRSHGYDTVIAIDAEAGHEQAVRRLPDLILLDIHMPGGDGLTLVQQLKSQPETRHIPFILVTASKDDDLRLKAMELGAAGFLEKPFDPGELIDLARYAIGDTQTINERPQPPPKPKPAVTPQDKKILIVEDDPKIAKALDIRLQSAGFKTTVAQDALVAVSTALRVEPDLVLLDISMPAGNGFTVAEKVKRLIPRPTPFIFLTASKQPGFRDKAKELGAAAYFEKPFDSEELLDSIQQTLN